MSNRNTIKAYSTNFFSDKCHFLTKNLPGVSIWPKISQKRTENGHFLTKNRPFLAKKLAVIAWADRGGRKNGLNVLITCLGDRADVWDTVKRREKNVELFYFSWNLPNLSKFISFSEYITRGDPCEKIQRFQPKNFFVQNAILVRENLLRSKLSHFKQFLCM